jgi:hypothetical protein
LAAAHAPGRVKLLGLFAVAFGLLAGSALGALARFLQVEQRTAMLPVAVILISAAQLGMALESWRVYRAEVRETLQADVPLPVPESLKSSIREDRRRMMAERMSFPAWLRHRVSPLKVQSRPWPELLFGAELVLGIAAGVWAFRRASRRAAESLNSTRSDG